jgi:hypothetical protein
MRRPASVSLPNALQFSWFVLEAEASREPES